MSVIALTTSGAAVNPSCDTNRAARIMRSGSSLNDCSGVTGVRNVRASRSASPPNRSTNSADGSRIAIALTAKSRRERSPSMLSPKLTSGLRDDDVVRVAAIGRDLELVLSPCAGRSCRTRDRRPTSRRPSAPTICSISSGLADVAKSQSLPGRPSTASRTGPPTIASSWPASVKSTPSSARNELSASTASILARRSGVSSDVGTGTYSIGHPHPSNMFR